MTKFEDWHFWLQVSVGVPQALLAGIRAWVWTPTLLAGFRVETFSNRERRSATLLTIYRAADADSSLVC